MRLNLELLLIFLSSLLASAGEQGVKPIMRPSASELERVVGAQLEQSIEVLSWKASAPQQTNVLIYSAAPHKFDESLLRQVAKTFSLTGEVSRITGETMGHVGYCIKESSPLVQTRQRSVYFWCTIGTFGYATGDDGYRYNQTTKRHEVFGVPEKEEAKEAALKLLPILRLSANDLEYYPSGRLRWASSPKTITYTDKEDKKRKTLTTARNITFYQRIPGGGTTTGVGDGGQIRFTFVSDGKVAGIEWFFRKLDPAGIAEPKSQEQIIRDLEVRNAFTWHQSVPSTLTITNCVLAYPQGNSWLDQKHVWPFYLISGVGARDEAVTLYVPVRW